MNRTGGCPSSSGWLRIRALVLAISLVGVACGLGLSRGDGDLLACDRRELSEDGPDFPNYLEGAQAWQRVTDASVGRISDAGGEMQVDGRTIAFDDQERSLISAFSEGEAYLVSEVRGQRERGDEASRAILHEMAARGLERALERGDEVWLGTSTAPGLVVSIDDSDTATIWGRCAHARYSREIERFIADQDESGPRAATSGEIVRALITDPDGELADRYLNWSNPRSMVRAGQLPRRSGPERSATVRRLATSERRVVPPEGHEPTRVPR